MATAVPHSAPTTSFDTFADLLESIGDVPLSRIRANPAPGTATENDVLAIHAREKRLYELIDGVLVEKTMGYGEAVLATEIARLIGNYLVLHKLGVVAGADGMIRFPPGVRIPDVSFVAWSSLQPNQLRQQPILASVPDLAVEVLSESNTRREMERKLREYFDAGVQLVWYLDPRARTMQIFTGVNQSSVVNEDGIVDGGDVLPGFTMRLADVFARIEESPT